MNVDAASEKELIRSFLSGNPSSLQTLIERHQNRLYSYIFLMVKDKQLADINTQIETAQQELKAGLDGFAKDMAGKILGRAL